MKTVAIGIQSFDKLREENYFYVDKTSFIKEWWESGDDVTLITRPRRFGKTLNMSMLECFFSTKYANRSDLFEDLSIWENNEYHTLQGVYPVINLSFANVKEQSYQDTKIRIFQLLKKLYNQNRFLLDSGLLNEAEKKDFLSINEEMGEVVATVALHNLSDFLYRYYGRKVIILLDEYDTPMQEAYLNGYWMELISFMRNLFNATFKTNPYLERGIMTGITRVSKESIFSDLNNLAVVTTTSNKYATSFGFTEAEVFRSLEEYGLGEEKANIKHWYDGFTFGQQKDIYNPWSIINFLDIKVYDIYWANTSSNSLVNQLIRTGDTQLKSSFESLLQGETISCPIDEQIVYNMLDGGEVAIWSLLVASGYLRVISYERRELVGARPIRYQLALTNYEVKCMFFSMVQNWFYRAGAGYNGFVKALLSDDIESMNAYMNRVTKSIFSYFDTSNSEPEKFYHGFVLGLMVELSDDYILTSNRESGFGRYDIMLEPFDKSKNAIIIEFKVRNEKKEKSLEETVQTALKQIEAKQYEANLITKGFPTEKIRKYGFAFEGKEVLIGF